MRDNFVESTLPNSSISSSDARFVIFELNMAVALDGLKNWTYQKLIKIIAFVRGFSTETVALQRWEHWLRLFFFTNFYHNQKSHKTHSDLYDFFALIFMLT